jgi:hypothetical protein
MNRDPRAAICNSPGELAERRARGTAEAVRSL